jgi:VanZ family protein
MRNVAPFAIFLFFLALWTWKLLEPNPVPETVNEEIPNDLKFYVAKALHAGAYAFLTVLAGYLPVQRSFFWCVIGVLALHAIGTEIGQTYVPNRHGSVRDVLVDWTGIAMGLVALRSIGVSPVRAAAGETTASLGQHDRPG